MELYGPDVPSLSLNSIMISLGWFSSGWFSSGIAVSTSAVGSCVDNAIAATEAAAIAIVTAIPMPTALFNNRN